MDIYHEHKAENDKFFKKYRQGKNIISEHKMKRRENEVFGDVHMRYKDKGYEIDNVEKVGSLFKQTPLLLNENGIMRYYLANKDIKDNINDKNFKFIEKINKTINENLMKDEKDEVAYKKKASNSISLNPIVEIPTEKLYRNMVMNELNNYELKQTIHAIMTEESDDEFINNDKFRDKELRVKSTNRKISHDKLNLENSSLKSPVKKISNDKLNLEKNKDISYIETKNKIHENKLDRLIKDFNIYDNENSDYIHESEESNNAIKNRYYNSNTKDKNIGSIKEKSNNLYNYTDNYKENNNKNYQNKNYIESKVNNRNSIKDGKGINSNLISIKENFPLNTIATVKTEKDIYNNILTEIVNKSTNASNINISKNLSRQSTEVNIHNSNYKKNKNIYKEKHKSINVNNIYNESNNRIKNKNSMLIENNSKNMNNYNLNSDSNLIQNSNSLRNQVQSQSPKHVLRTKSILEKNGEYISNFETNNKKRQEITTLSNDFKIFRQSGFLINSDFLKSQESKYNQSKKYAELENIYEKVSKSDALKEEILNYFQDNPKKGFKYEENKYFYTKIIFINKICILKKKYNLFLEK